MPDQPTNGGPADARDDLASALTDELVRAIAALAQHDEASLRAAIAPRVVAHTQSVRRRDARIERLAMVGQLSASVVHELRNPLSVIETSAFILAECGRSDERIGRHARRIAEQVALAAGIVGDLLEAARDRPLVLAPVDIAAVCRAAVGQVPWPADATVSLDLPADLPAAPGDARRLRQVITNLVANAFEAMGGRGQVIVAASADADRVTISVTDDGPGIPVDEIDRLFEPLFSTRSHGTGLGLALSRDIARAHRGDLVARNVAPHGAQFELQIPRETR